MPAVLDGTIVALDPAGATSFSQLQQRMHVRAAPVRVTTVRREHATQILTSMLTRLCAQDVDPLLGTVTSIDIFGSYAHGAADPGDIDVNIELDSLRAKKILGLASYDLSGRHETAVRRALFGGTRAVSAIFQARMAPSMYPFPLTMLWQSGDTHEDALTRLHSIEADPAASRAEREHMLPAFEGLDKWLPIYLRQRIADAVHTGALAVSQVVVPEVRFPDRDISQLIDRRWKPGGALNRAAHSAMSWLAAKGATPAQVHLHGEDIEHGALTPYVAGFQLRYIHAVPRLCTEYGAQLILEIPRLTLRQPQPALELSLLDSARFPVNHGHVVQWTVTG